MISALRNRKFKPINGLTLVTRPPPRRTSHSVPKDSSPRDAQSHLTHINAQTGTVCMVDVASKPPTDRLAMAQGRIRLGSQRVFDLLSSSPNTAKGNVFTTAQLTGIQGAKSTSALIPLCHAVPLSHVGVTLRLDAPTLSVVVESSVRCVAQRTGVEMEALVAVSVTCLTVWDMVKGVDGGRAGREMCVEDVRVIRKAGGRSGDWVRD